MKESAWKYSCPNAVAEEFLFIDDYAKDGESEDVWLLCSDP